MNYGLHPDLPPGKPRRWTPRLKAAVIRAIRNKVISVWDACERYSLSAEEIAQWERNLDQYGIPGLRTTRVSIYRKTSNPKMSGAGGRHRERKVLIVEDNVLNMKLFNDLLEAHGYTTLQSNDGLNALQLARLHRPDLILIDIQLPVVSGLEITKRLKADEELRGIPIIAVTAFAMKGDEEKIRQAGCDGYLTKPISITGFMQTVERYSGAVRQ